MKNKDIILFILVICVLYLILCDNKKNKEVKDLKESVTNSKESFTNGNEGITESIKNLGIIAQKIQENGSFTFPGNIIIKEGSSITFEGPSGKGTILYFNQGLNGLEIAQIGGANKLRLYVENSGGFDIGANTLTTAGNTNSLVLANDITTTGKVVADRSVDSKGSLRLLNFNSTEKFKISQLEDNNILMHNNSGDLFARNSSTGNVENLGRPRC